MVSRQVSGTFACRGERFAAGKTQGDKGLRRGWGRVLDPKAQPCPATGLKGRSWDLLATPANAYTLWPALDPFCT